MTEPTTTRVGPSAMPRDANAGKRTPRSTAAAAVAWSCLVSRLEDAELRKPPPLFASSPGRAQPVPLPLSAIPPKQHGFSAGVASSPLQRSVRSLPLSWSSPSSRSLVLLARRQLCTSSLQMLAGRRLLSPAASLPVRRRPTAVDCSWHRDLDPPLIAVAKRCVQKKKHRAPIMFYIFLPHFSRFEIKTFNSENFLICKTELNWTHVVQSAASLDDALNTWFASSIKSARPAVWIHPVASNYVLHSCVVNLWVFLAIRLPKKFGEESSICSAQRILFVALCSVCFNPLLCAC